MGTFVLQLQDIDESNRDWEFSLESSWLQHALKDSELRSNATADPGRFRVSAQRNGTEILVRSRIEAQLLTDCARCLEDVPLRVDVDVTTLFTPEHTRPDAIEELELAEDDLFRDYYAGPELVLDDLVREHLVLETPMKALCSEDCQGIEIPEHVRPPKEIFGDRVDSRFAPLMKLKQKLAKSEE